MADNIRREAYAPFLAPKAPCPAPPAPRIGGQGSLLRQEAMNSPHLRGKLLELLAVILLWFFYSLREFSERAYNDRFLRQRLTTFAGNRDKGLDSHGGLFRDPDSSPSNTRTVACDVA